MARLQTAIPESGSENTEALFAAVRQKMGRVPNMYTDLGKLSPGVLGAALQMEGAVHRSGLTPAEIEAIKLAVSDAAGCEYCLAAHTALARRLGHAPEQIAAWRRGQSAGQDRAGELARFARMLVTSRGTVDERHLAAVRAAGIDDVRIAATLLVIAAIVLTNLFNRVNDTAIDFPDPS